MAYKSHMQLDLVPHFVAAMCYHKFICKKGIKTQKWYLLHERHKDF